MLTIACVWVRGPYPYTAEYVVRLHQMVDRYIGRRPYRFTCLTDQPDALRAHPGWWPTNRLIPIDALAGAAIGYWNKLRLFDSSITLVGRTLYLDLDSLIVNSLDAIIDYDAPFALAPDALIAAPRTVDRNGRHVVRRYNSSVMVFDADWPELYRIWAQWTPADAERLSTDQDWIGERAAWAASMPLAWFPRLSMVQPPWPADAKVVLCKKPKNHEAALRWPWFEQAWR